MKTLLKVSFAATLVSSAAYAFAGFQSSTASTQAQLTEQSNQLADTCIRVRTNADGTKTVTQYRC